jgi:hypothetical protein
MANLSQFLGGGAGSEGDPRKEGAPLYGMYGGSMNNFFDTLVRDATSHECVSSPWGGATTSTASYSYGSMSQTQGYGYSGDAGAPNSQLTSQDSSSWNQWSQALFQNDQYPHFLFGSCSHMGRLAWNSIHANMGVNSNDNLISHTSMPAGTRPRRYFTLYNNTFAWRKNSHLQSVNGGHHIVDKVSASTLTGVSRVNSNTTSNGMGTYNERTKTLVLMWGAGNRNVDVAVFRSTKNLNTVARLSDFFDNATVTNYQFDSSQNPTNLSTMNYSCVMFLDDNDKLTTHWSHSSTAYLYTSDLSGSGGLVTSSQLDQTGQTTSYGPEQGLQYRPKLQTSWDHKWVVMYRQYYQYGGGYQAYFVSTEDSSRWFKSNFTTNNGGGAFFPSGRTGFIHMHGTNADSAGCYVASYDFTTTSTTGTDSTTYGFSTNASSSDLGAIANQAALSTAHTYVHSGYWYSTNYPRYCTVNWWPKENAGGGYFAAEDYTGA